MEIVDGRARVFSLAGFALNLFHVCFCCVQAFASCFPLFYDRDVDLLFYDRDISLFQPAQQHILFGGSRWNIP